MTRISRISPLQLVGCAMGVAFSLIDASRTRRMNRHDEHTNETYPESGGFPATDFCSWANSRSNIQTPKHKQLWRDFTHGRKWISSRLPYLGACTHTGPVFGVGLFKTGTTSLSHIMNRELGYTSCGATGGFYPIVGVWRKFWDGPATVHHVLGNDSLRTHVRTMANGTLHASDGPWLFFFKVQ